MINVTKTTLPPLADYVKYLEGIWARCHLTNHGPLVLELESRLKEYLGVKHLFFVSNGTIALQIAIKALELKGDIITTPFSYVATTSSIVWEGCRPVFADIEPDTLTIDPQKIAAAITPAATAILATHVYGNACDVRAIKQLADRHHLKVIYDAAHAFGSRYEQRALASYGDISTLSFHATKLFQTAEGGAVVTNDDALAHKISYLRNFGHHGQEAFWGVGVNGKNSEFHAAMGLCTLDHVPGGIARRKQISQLYDTLLGGSLCQSPKIRVGTDYNYAYYPVLFADEARLLAARAALNREDIYPRRYFYPSLNSLNYVAPQAAPIAESASQRVLCLPLYPELADKDVERISQIISLALRNAN